MRHSRWLLLVLPGFVLPTTARAQRERDPASRSPVPATGAPTPFALVADPFARADETALDSLYGPLIYLLRPEQRGIYPSLSVSGKRAFLRSFWAERDSGRTAPRHPAEDVFNARIAQVDRKFREGEVAGWRTDRGRIYLAAGPPDIILSRRGAGLALPFEVWKYTRGTSQPRKYCFVDLTWFGNYVLVYSNDPAMPARADWRVLLGEAASEDVLRF